VLGSLAVLVWISHLIGATMLRRVLWGSHFYGYLPPIVLDLASVALVAVMVWALRPTPADGPAAATPSRAWPPAIRRAGWVALLFATAAFLWGFRIRHGFLGDASAMLQNIPLGERFHPRQPLTAVIHHYVYELTRRWFDAPGRSASDVTFDTVAISSTATGLLFLPLAVALGRALVEPAAESPPTAGRTLAPGGDGPLERRGIAWLATAVLLSQGYAQLFFGYAENYTFFTAALALYLWSGLGFVRGRLPLLAPAAAIVLAIAFNIAGAIILPSLGWLVVLGLARPGRRAASLRDAAIGLGLGLAAAWGLMALGGHYHPVAEFRYMVELALFGAHEHGRITYLFSLDHARDFYCLQLLIGPLGSLLFVPSALRTVVTRGLRDPRANFLMLAAGPALLASWVTGDLHLGFPRDWDLFSPYALLYVSAALHALASEPIRPRRLRSLLGLALATSLFHTASWIAVNGSFDRGFTRFQDLPISRGRTEFVVGYYYFTHGDPVRAKEWFARALRVYPANNAAHYHLGLYDMDEHRFEDAVRHFRVAVRMRPDKTNYRFELVDALVMAGRPAEARPELERLTRAVPGRAVFWACYGIVLRGVGEGVAARAALERAASLAPHDSLVGTLLRRVDEPDAYEWAVREAWDDLATR
jgi:hypothetical protein